MVERTKTDFNALLKLILAQALAGSCAPLIVTLGGVIGYLIAPDIRLATLPVSLLSIGVATASFPTSMIMQRFGRSFGFYVGCALMLLGGVLAGVGLYFESFTVFCLGSFSFGLSYGVAQYFRFAAADFASEKDKPKVVSWVLIGGVASAILGPQIILWTRDALAWLPNGAPFLIIALFSVPIAWLISQLSFAKLSKAKVEAKTVRPLGVILSEAPIIVAITCATIAASTMSLVMTAAPVAMEHVHHLGKTDTVLAIQWHVLAMYLPSFFTGLLIVRFGVRLIISLGMLCFLGAATIALMGHSVPYFWVSLIFLGIGWNFGFIGGTSLLTQSYRSDEKIRIEGVNDTIIFTTMSASSLGAGALLGWLGWEMINYCVFPVVIATLLMLWFVRR